MASSCSVDRIALKLLSKIEKKNELPEMTKTSENRCHKYGKREEENDLGGTEVADEPTNTTEKDQCLLCGADLQFSVNLSLFGQSVFQTYSRGPLCSKCFKSLEVDTVKQKYKRLAPRTKATEERNDDTLDPCGKISKDKYKVSKDNSESSSAIRVKKEPPPKFNTAFLCLKCGIFYSSQLFLEKHFLGCNGSSGWQVEQKKPRVLKSGKLEYLCPMCSILYFQRPSFFRHVVRCYAKRVQKELGSDREINLKIDVRRYVAIETLLKDLKEQCKNLGIMDIPEVEVSNTSQANQNVASALLTSKEGNMSPTGFDSKTDSLPKDFNRQSEKGEIIEMPVVDMSVETETQRDAGSLQASKEDEMSQTEVGRNECAVERLSVDSKSDILISLQSSILNSCPSTVSSSHQKTMHETVPRYRKRSSSQTASDVSEDDTFLERNVSPTKTSTNVGPRIKLPRMTDCNLEILNPAVREPTNAVPNNGESRQSLLLKTGRKQGTVTVFVKRKVLKKSVKPLSAIPVKLENNISQSDNLLECKPEKDVETSSCKGSWTIRSDEVPKVASDAQLSTSSGRVCAKSGQNQVNENANGIKKTLFDGGSVVVEKAQPPGVSLDMKSGAIKPIVSLAENGEELLQCPKCEEIYFRLYNFNKHTEQCQPSSLEKIAKSTTRNRPKMENVDQPTLVVKLKERGPKKPIIVLTARGEGLLQCPKCEEIYFRLYNFNKHVERCNPVSEVKPRVT